jgi:DNA-binding NarL/FixJ family response regulator
LDVTRARFVAASSPSTRSINSAARGFVSNQYFQSFRHGAEAAEGQEAVELAKKECPDSAILDIQTPWLNGIQAAEEILPVCPNTIILSESMRDADLFSHELLNIGLKGFVCKLAWPRDFDPAVEAVMHGQICFTSMRD